MIYAKPTLEIAHQFLNNAKLRHLQVKACSVLQSVGSDGVIMVEEGTLESDTLTMRLHVEYLTLHPDSPAHHVQYVLEKV